MNVIRPATLFFLWDRNSRANRANLDICPHYFCAHQHDAILVGNGGEVEGRWLLGVSLAGGWCEGGGIRCRPPPANERLKPPSLIYRSHFRHKPRPPSGRHYCLRGTVGESTTSGVCRSQLRILGYFASIPATMTTTDGQPTFFFLLFSPR